MAAANAMEVMKLAGCIIMEYGGETFRVEDTLMRMGAAMGLADVQCFAVPSGVFISFVHEDGECETGLIRVHAKDTNLTRVNEVNRISRSLASGEIGMEQAYERLIHINEAKPLVGKTLCAIAAGVSAGGFAMMYSGGAVEFAVAFVVATLVQYLSSSLDRYGLSGMPSALIGSFLSVLVTLLFHELTGLCAVDAAVAGELMPMVPGLAMTNAVQDTLRGDNVSGVSHAVRALITAALIAGGVMLATVLIRWMGGAV